MRNAQSILDIDDVKFQESGVFSFLTQAISGQIELLSTMEEQVEKNCTAPSEAKSSNEHPTVVVNLDTLVFSQFRQQLKYFYMARLKETESKMYDLVRISEEKLTEQRNLLNEMRKQQNLLVQYGIELQNLDLSCNDIKTAIENARLTYDKTIDNLQATCEKLMMERQFVMEEELRKNMSVLSNIGAMNETPAGVVGLYNQNSMMCPNVVKCKPKKRRKRKRKTDGEDGTSKKSCDELLPKEISPRYTLHDVHCLFIRQIPLDATEDDIKALSSDIVAVCIPKTRRGRNRSYGFIEFTNEDKAKENLLVLQEATIKGQKFHVELFQREKPSLSVTSDTCSTET